MQIKRTLLLFGLGGFLAGSILAKDLPKTYESPVALSKSDLKKLQKTKEEFAVVLAAWNAHNEKYNPEKNTNRKIDSVYTKEAFPSLLQISQQFEEVNNKYYDIFQKNCLAFWETHKWDKPQGLDEAKRYQKEGAIYMNKAQLNRRAAESYAKEYGKAYDRYFEAISLEIIAAKKAARALQYYKDWPVHYPYVFDEDIEVDLFNPQKPEVAKVEEAPKPIDTPKPAPVIAEIKKPIVTVVEEKPDSVTIFYRVQLAAHTVQLSAEYLKQNIYSGNLKVDEIKEDGWYKYLVGKFKTVEEAGNLLNQIKAQKELKAKATNAFVAAYRNGKRVQVKVAKESTKK